MIDVLGMVFRPRGISRVLYIASTTSVLVHVVVLASLDFFVQANTKTDVSTRFFAELVGETYIQPSFTPQSATPILDHPPSHELPPELSQSDNNWNKLPRTPTPDSITESNLKSGKKNSGRSNEVSKTYYFPSHLLERAPVPVSAPNPREHLTGTAIPAIPIKLRLYINASGTVVNIEVLGPDFLDTSLIEPIKNMFYATSFIAGNRRGKDVGSYINIEIELSDFIR